MARPRADDGVWQSGSLVLNGDSPYLLTHNATQQFIARLQRERQNGFGFVPFVGAGFSAPSGVPLVWEIKSYLARCICMALGAEEPGMRAWNPRTDQWPPFIDRDRPEPVETWELKVNGEIRSRRDRDRWDPELPVFQEALGAMAEWRTALLFLSRLVRDTRGTGAKEKEVVSLDAPQQEIIDACFREVLRDKYPTLGHRMLAALAGALRLDLVITTNFDDLLERAFAAARNPLEVFELHLPSNLPHWTAVSNVRSLIKLHGGRYSLRADYSLDGLPSEPDKQRFLEYLLSQAGRSEFSRDPSHVNLPFHNHLLVMGFSANDRRTRSLIEYAWKHLDRDFCVYWLCYSGRDVERIKDFTAEYRVKKLTREEAPTWHGSCILRHTNLGLFLLQVYQTIRKNLPPLGSLFPSVSRLTAPPLPSSRRAASPPALTGGLGVPPAEGHHQPMDPSQTGKSVREEILSCLGRFEEPDFARHRLVVASSTDGVAGLTSACGSVFRDLEADHVCLWLDMNDISNTDNLFETLLEAAYFRLGLENWTPVYIAGESRPRAAEIQRLVNSVSIHWVIFLNARETPGANADPSGLLGVHGWLDDRSSSLDADLEDRSACVEWFLDLLTELCGPQTTSQDREKSSRRVSVVLLCREVENQQPPLFVELANNGLLHSHVRLTKDSRECIEFPEDSIVASAIRWTAENAHQHESRQRFLHALVLMQRPRFLATIWSSALTLPPPKGQEIAEHTPAWVDELEDRGLVRRKEGGFIWIHSRCRSSLRKILREPDFRQTWLNRFPEAKTAFAAWHPEDDEPEIHESLAGWYGKVLDASDAPPSVFEIVYHLCRAADTAISRRGAKGIEFAGTKIEAAAALLKTHSFLIQTHGYSRGSCRRLEYVRDTLCDKIDTLGSIDTVASKDLQRATLRLRIVCTEVMRAIAREVGEDAKTYQRHQQLGFLRLVDLTSEAPESWKSKWKKWRSTCTEKAAKGAISNALYEVLSRGGDDSNGSRAVEWLRWCRWSAMLAIGARSFEPAEEALSKALRYAEDWKLLEEGKMSVFGVSLEGSRQNLRMEVLRIVEQIVALRLLRDSVDHRVAALGVSNPVLREELNLAPYPKADAERCIGSIEELIAWGQAIALTIRQKDHSSDSHNTMRAVWCESRLLMHQSVCAVRRIQLEPNLKDMQLRNAMGLLGDAEANLRFSDARRDRSELALVELHRAEARLREAESVPVLLPDGTTFSFSQLCRYLESKEPFTMAGRGQKRAEPDAGWARQRNKLREEFLGSRDSQNRQSESVPNQLRRAKSLVADAMRFLNRAEPVLRDRRRNVWWTTWFFERRLRVIALSIWASVFETNTPIPFLGLEAAMRKTATLADSLLDDAIRMIRVDAYRLATTVDSYASCAKALQLRLMLDKDSIRLQHRQDRMQERLSKALKELDRVREKRDDVSGFAKQTRERNEIDKKVRAYVDAVRKRCEAIAEHLKEGG
jgi:hypothetical protein